MLEPDIQVMVAQYLMDAAVMWKKLKEMYEQVNPAARFNAYAEFFNIHKKDDESLTNLVSCKRLGALALQLSQLSSLNLSSPVHVYAMPSPRNMNPSALQSFF